MKKWFCIKLEAQLADPAAPHYHPHHQEDASRHRHKGPARREKDRQRAAAHRARLSSQLSSAAQSGPPASTVQDKTAAPAVDSPLPSQAGSAISPPPATFAATTPPSSAPPLADTARFLPKPPPAASAEASYHPPQPRVAVSTPSRPSASRPTLPHFLPHQVLQDALCPDVEYYRRSEQERLEERSADLENIRKMIEKSCNF